MTKTKTIVLIHGNFVNNITWAAWKRHYEQKGYTVHTPANPGHDGKPADLRAKVHPDLVATGFIDIIRNLFFHAQDRAACFRFLLKGLLHGYARVV
jgi:esterase/lipase